MKMLGLYVHTPFCINKCHYCNFVITLKNSAAKESRFLANLEKEILHRAPGVRGRKFDTLYFGGGTPSALSEKDLEAVFSLLRKNFKFKPSAEVTLEANPGDISPSKARRLKALGVDRVSLGAQSFHDRTLKRMNRSHGVREIHTSYQNLRDAGIRNINLDLMLSLPGETLEDLQHSLQKLKRLDPEHISLYELVLEDKTFFKKQHDRGKLVLPGEDLQVDMLRTARNFLKNGGWRQYELLNYAKPGYESSHNRIYWRNEEYLGLGPGAFSYLEGKRFQYCANFEEYLKKTASGDWTNAEEEILTAEKKETESFVLALRTFEGADRKKFGAWLRKRNGTLRDLSEKGLIEEKNSRIRLTEHGKFFAETVFGEFSSA